MTTDTTDTTQTTATPDALSMLQSVAQQLCAAADAYNVRLKAEAANLDSGAIYARLQEEQRLRGMANQLYFQAADAVIAEAVGDEQALSMAVNAAVEQMAAIAKFAAVLDLMGDVLALAAAILSRKPATILEALKAVQHDVSAAPLQ